MKKITNKKKAITFAVVFLLIFGLTLGALYVNWNNNYRNRINPRTHIGQIDLSGLTIEQAAEKINSEADRLELEGLPISYNQERVVLPSIIAANTDLSFPVFIFNKDEVINELTHNSLNDSFSAYLSNYIRGTFLNTNISMIYTFDEARAQSYLAENFQDIEIAPLNAAFKVNKNNDSQILFDIEPERIGRQIDFDLAFEQINDRLKNLNSQNVVLKTITSRPLVHAGDLESLRPAAELLISRGDLKLTATSTNASSSFWTVKKEIIASWIIGAGEKNNYHISLDVSKISEYLKNNIAINLDKEPQKPRYEISGGKMTSWQTGADGQKLNTEESAAAILEQYLNQNNNEIKLIVEIAKNTLAENTNNLNIQEIIGTGHSKFSGSPVNRRHNIKVGADAVNGILIAPGEEFSLVKTLGEIDASTGYLPELVIKENKTIPEFGGGLCQVGTTIFRSALASGLPITARQNHSYRVVYYEPAGTDAAIYDPWPDVRFLNDSGNYILIQSRIVKDDLYFDFWGKKDGRIVSSTVPVVYNITKPAPAKTVETTDLKPGETKCTETAHNGADAYFDYSVTYPSGDLKSTRFKSHYVPWQKVCLVGKALATSTPIIATSTTATSTP